MSADSIVLIVDDEAWGRETLSSLLKPLGCKLIFAENGFQALALARTYGPDLVLLDVMMPDMDGYETCEIIRRDPALAEMPILMVTALDDRTSRLQGIQAGADDFITKPFDRLELRNRVQTITRLNRYRRIQTERAKFEWVVERADQGYLLLDEAGHIIYMNAQARLFFLHDDELDPTQPPLFLELVKDQYQIEPAEAWANWPLPNPKDLPRFLVRPQTAITTAFWLQVDSVELPQAVGSQAIGSQTVGSQAGGTGILVQLLNVTERINMVREQRTFHALVNHRLGTPIRMMLSGLDGITFDEEDQADLMSVMAIVQRGAERLKSDIEEILVYLDAPGPSRREPGLGLADLPALIRRVADRLGLAHVSWQIPQNAQGVDLVLGSRFVEMIFLELLENSLKFHPAQDPVVEIALSLANDDAVLITVRDNGVHLSPDQLAQVWSPYYQAEKGFSGQMAGLGLGLSTVASMVWGVGGRCQMQNRMTAPGIEVHLLLPQATPAGERV